MSWDGVPWFIGGAASHSADVARLLGYAAAGGNDGILGALDLLVTQQTVPAGGITVNAGACTIVNRATAQPYSAYAARKTAAENVAISPTGGAIRSDLIVARVENPNIAGEGWSTPPAPASGPYIFTRVISGVPSSTTTLQQVAGSSTQSGIALARIDIPASTSTITNAMIVDLRKVARPRRDQQLYTATPGGNNDLTSATYVNWPTVATWSVPVPTWATQARLKLFLGGVNVPTAASAAVGTLRASLGASTFPATPYNTDTAATVLRPHLITGGTITVPSAMRGTTQTLLLQGLRTSGAAFLRADVSTPIFAEIEFVEVPSAS